MLSRLDAFSLDLESSLDRAELAVAAAAADLHGDAALYHPAFFKMLTLVDLDRLADAVDELGVQRHISQRIRASWTIPLHHGLSAVVSLYAGRLDVAEAEALSGLQAVRDVGVGARRGLAVGGLGDGRDRARQSGRRTRPPRVSGRQLGCPDAAARIDLFALAGARELFAAIDMPSCIRVVAPDLVRLAVATDHAELAAAATLDLDEIAARTGLPLDDAAALAARGQIERDATALLGAVELMAKASRPLREAECRELCAIALWEAGRRHDAARMLAASKARFLDAGATGAARRTGRLFSDLGLCRPREGRRTDGVPHLTGRESTIVELVADGCSNQVIADELGISKRTVETHLIRV